MLSKEEKIYCPFCCLNVVGVKEYEEEREVDENKKLYGEACETCKEGLSLGVNLFCVGKKGEVEHEGKMVDIPCCNIITVSKEVLEKNGFVEGKDFELGGKIEIKGCVQCSPDRKIHF